MKTFALVTGASKGIGKCFAMELAKRGYNLVLVARSASLLENLKSTIENDFKVEVYWLDLDLSELNAPKKLLEFCQNHKIPVSILINNAGYGLFGDFQESDLDKEMNMLDLNIGSLVRLSHLFIPELKKNEKAYILNIASTAAYQTVPQLNAYSASKAFVLSFSRGLSFELKNTSISVTCLSPGSTKTDFMERAEMKNPKILATAEKLGMNPEDVAKIGLDAMFKGIPEIIPGLINWVGAFLTRLIPKILTEKIAASLYKE